MSLSTVFGILVGSVMLIAAIALQVSGAKMPMVEQAWGIFVNIPGVFIVLGGTAAATFISFPFDLVSHVFDSLIVVFKREPGSRRAYIHEITKLAALSRSDAIAFAEKAGNIRNPFLRDGMKMLADNFKSEEITEIMQQRIDFRSRKEASEAHIFRTMAKFSPSFGMIGTLIGLIGMLGNMGADDTISRIGGDMAVALVTTFYGLILANLFFIPFATKLEHRTREETETMYMIQESIVMIAESWHPRKVEDYLNSYVRPAERTRTKLEISRRKRGQGDEL